MGTPGMRYSLVSREIIADSIEAVAGAEGFDGVIAIGGCDKNMPACVMAMGIVACKQIFTGFGDGWVAEAFWCACLITLGGVLYLSGQLLIDRTRFMELASGLINLRRGGGA